MSMLSVFYHQIILKDTQNRARLKIASSAIPLAKA